MRFILAAVFAASAFAQTSALMPVPRQQPLSNNGTILTGGCVYTYAAGTTTPQTTWSDAGLTTPNTNPIVLNAFGRGPAIYLSATSYKIVIGQKSLGSCPGSPGTVIWSQDVVADSGLLLKVNLAAAGGSALIGFEQAGGNLITIGAAVSSLGLLDAGFSSLATGCANVPTGAALITTKAWIAVTTQTLNCNVYFLPGGITQPAAGQVVTFANMPSIPGLRQVFDASVGGPGSILLSAPAGPVSPEWFGVAVGTTNGAANQAALTAAQRALPVFGTNPQGLYINQGMLQFGATGNAASYYPLASTILLSPHVTLSGAPSGQTLIAAQSGFTGSYVFDSINQNGTGNSPDNNFDQGLTNLFVDATQHTTTNTGCVNWLASLHSRLENLTCYTRATAYSIGMAGFGDDGTTARSLSAYLFARSSGDTQILARGFYFPGQSNETLINTFENLKCGYSSAYPTGNATGDSGYILSTLGCLATESGVNGLIVNGFSSENHPLPITIGPGSSNVRITAIAEYADCVASCIQGTPAGSPSGMTPYYPSCANIISPLATNVHLQGYANHFKFVLCIGNPWTPSTAYGSNQTIIDANGHVQAVQVAGTSAATPPSPSGWNSGGGFTTDGTVTWFDVGMLSIICNTNQNAGQIFDALTGSQSSCVIPSISFTQSGSKFGTPTGPLGASDSSDNTNYFFEYDSNRFWNPTTPGSGVTLLNNAPAIVDMNVTTDQELIFNYPRGFTKAVLQSVTVGACSTSMAAGGGITAGGFYANPAKAGGLVAGTAGTTYSALTATNKFQAIPLNATYTTPGNMFIQGINDAMVFSLTTAAGFAATCEVSAQISYLP